MTEDKKTQVEKWKKRKDDKKKTGENFNLIINKIDENKT